MEKTTAEIYTLESWFKLSFRLIVGDHWEDVAPYIIDGDTTYRWCREMILASLRKLEMSSNKLLSSAISNVKSEIWKLRSIFVDDTEHPKAGLSSWENTFAMAFDLNQNLPEVANKLDALKLAMVAGTFSSSGEKTDTSSLKAKLFPAILKLKDLTSGQPIYEEVLEAFYIFAEYLDEEGIDTDREKAQMGKRTKRTDPISWQTPESWCFGDFGNKNGQFEYPVDVLVNKQGEFLVLEENSKGKQNTIQRVQFFDRKGRYLKTLLQRGFGGITSMSDMALDNEGNLVVSLKDGNGVGRVNVYNVQGECVREIDVLVPNPEFPPYFTCVAVDQESRILVVEHNEMSIQVYGNDGKFLFKFGEWAHNGKDGAFDNVYSLNCSQNNDIYVCDPFQRVQVFNSKGKFLRSFKPAGIVPSNLIVREKDDLVYGINRDAHTLEVYSLDGARVVRKVGGFGSELGKLWRPMGTAMTPEGTIAVAEKESHRIQVIKI